MLSAIFVDRPRLAIVIAIVMTIAGAVSLLVIPIAQYPDIVPPQVSVTTVYPGANSAVVDSTIAQPIEAQVVGVDKMIYMKSVSGDDGSYSLTASFELGTDPDINTVNVNNRVQIALSGLPQDVQRQGITVKKKSSALLGVIALYSPKHTHDQLFLSNYVTINMLDQIKSTPGVGDATLWGPQDYSMRAWVRTDRLTGLNLTTGDIINAIKAQNVQAAVGRIGARPTSNDQQLQLNIQTKGRLTSTAEFENIVVRTNPDVPKHQGISCLLVPMTSPGIAVRPLVLMTGHHHFNEVFFTDVVVPKANLLGPVNQGWKVSTTTLMYERHSAGGRSHTAQIARLIALARRVEIDGRPAWDHPAIRQRLAQLAIDSEALKYTRLRSLTRQLRGEPPGPEGSVLKLSGSELGVRIADAAGELLGMHVLVNQPSPTVPDAPRWFNRVLAARQYTISAGTSEIQRNIIGERVLGLPRG